MFGRLSDLVDLDRYLRSRLEVRNAGGGRGYDSGVRVYDCPLCGDARGRGWTHVLGFVVGCYNAGCEADPRLEGGVVEFVRRFERLRSRGEAWQFLHREYPRGGPPPAPVLEPEVEDFCRLPPETRYDWLSASVVMREASTFISSQWGLAPTDALRWSLGLTTRGRYAWRVIVPVVMSGQVVSFQARTFRRADPKYLVARHDGDRPECGRPAAACLFNYDAIQPGRDLIIVEGAGDCMAWERRETGTPSIALLGQALTPQKLALIAAKRPARCVVALDAGAAEERRAGDHASDLEAWGILAAVGEWAGAKDAGAGAELEIGRRATLSERVARRLGR